MKRNQTVTYRPTTSMQSTSTFSLPRNTSSTTSTQEKVMSSLDGILSRRKTTPSRPQTHYGTAQQSPPTLLRKPSYKHAEGVRRHGWTEGGQQDDPVSQPTMKRIGVGVCHLGPF
ncbi:hypothetical protein BC829DRAFT_207431 [Chytridium lagenaria]|nr:hypothetical protein BC829DRAFT_207431 [Chytridium lagenaria]